MRRRRGSRDDSSEIVAPEFRSRGYLPHFDGDDVGQMITYRLADSLPRDWTTDRRRVESMLDRGIGNCILRDPQVAAMIIDNWRHFDGQRYDLHAWVVMPNHAHLVVTIREAQSLPQIVHGWKSYSAHRIRKIVGATGRIWQPEYWDRFIRNDDHFDAAVEYVENNPVAAGLVADAADWPFSSAAQRHARG